MRITISSPDGLGDFILRMSLVEALLAAGHQLQMIMRLPASDFAQALFPEINVQVLAHDPFQGTTKKMLKPFKREVARIEGFKPDLYIAGTFQLNFFDEIFLKKHHKNLCVAGFEAEEDFWPSDTTLDPRELSQKFDIRVRASTAMPEGDKNLRLAASVLGVNQVERIRARPPTEASLTKARAILAAFNIREREFIIVCAGSRPGLVMKDWGEKNWEKLFRLLVKRETRAFVFLGNPKEAVSIERLRAVLPPDIKHVNLAERPPPIGVSYALVSLASAYLGRDSGIMHMAAAANIPLLGLFSGGHWPRFLPEAERGIILTRIAACRGCNFFCPFSEPWCVTSIPCDAVVSAWHKLTKVTSLEIREFPTEEPWISQVNKTDFTQYARESLTKAHTTNVALKKTRWWNFLRHLLIAL